MYPSEEIGCGGPIPLHFFFIFEAWDEEVEFSWGLSESHSSVFRISFETSLELLFDLCDILGLRFNLTGNPSLQVVKVDWWGEVGTKGGYEDVHVEALKPLHSVLKLFHNFAVLVKTVHIHPHLIDTQPHWLELCPALRIVCFEFFKFCEEFFKGLVSSSFKIPKLLVLSLDLDTQGLNSGFPLELSIRDFLGEDS